MTDISPGAAGLSDTSSAGTWPKWLTRRRLMFVGAASVIGGGMALNWGWLTAIGLAPILVRSRLAPRCAGWGCA